MIAVPTIVFASLSTLTCCTATIAKSYCLFTITNDNLLHQTTFSIFFLRNMSSFTKVTGAIPSNSTSTAATQPEKKNKIRLRCNHILKVSDDALFHLISFADRNSQFSLMQSCRNFLRICERSDDITRIGRIFAQNYQPKIYSNVTYFSHNESQFTTFYKREENGKSISEVIHQNIKGEIIRHNIPEEHTPLYFDTKANKYFLTSYVSQLKIWDVKSIKFEQQIPIGWGNVWVIEPYIFQYKSLKEISIRRLDSVDKERIITGDFKSIEIISVTKDNKSIFTITDYGLDEEIPEIDEDHDEYHTQRVIEIRDLETGAITKTINPREDLNKDGMKLIGLKRSIPFYDHETDELYMSVSIRESLDSISVSKALIYDNKRSTGKACYRISSEQLAPHYYKNRTEIVNHNYKWRDLKNRVIYLIDQQRIEARSLENGEVIKSAKLPVQFDPLDKVFYDDITGVMLISDKDKFCFFDLVSLRYIKGFKTKYNIADIVWDRYNRVIYILEAQEDTVTALYAYDYSLEEKLLAVSEQNSKKSISWSATVLGNPKAASASVVPPLVIRLISAQDIKKMQERAEQILKKDEDLSKKIEGFKTELLAEHQKCVKRGFTTRLPNYSEQFSKEADYTIEIYRKILPILDTIQLGKDRDCIIIHMVHFFHINTGDVFDLGEILDKLSDVNIADSILKIFNMRAYWEKTQTYKWHFY